ncbi:chondroitin sulfate N-acetylgalactosaminyltransferase 1 [Daphnia magna]|uniref:chondroitin sulfate N-acetylgalactosaminyltransferase 1 n=1 Tax=Daphnia magna TaxID=35525 RepID=UPI001E1BDD02|nr:chondroitin sulfate N-acetylgalactosaminyltransferase 1 [Daphnia magna]
MNRSARRVLLRLFLLALPLVVLTFVAVSLLSSNVDSLHSHNALTFASKVIQPCGSQLPLEIVAPTEPSPSSLPHEELKRQLKQLKQVISQLEDRLRLQGGIAPVGVAVASNNGNDVPCSISYIQKQIEQSEIEKGKKWHNEYEIIPHSLFTLQAYYSTEAGMGRRVVERPIGSRRQDLQEAVSSALSVLNNNRDRGALPQPAAKTKRYVASDFVEGLYRLDPIEGTQYELWFNHQQQPAAASTDNHSKRANLVKVSLLRPHAPLVAVRLEQPLQFEIPIVNIIVPLSGRLSAFESFLNRFKKNVLTAGQSRIHLTVVFFGDKHWNEIQREMLIFEKASGFSNFHLLNINSTFSRARGLQVGVEHWENSPIEDDVLIFLCDVDVAFDSAFLERCRRNAQPKRQAYFPIVFSQYNPNVTRRYTRHRDDSQVPTLHKDTGFWRDFGFGMVCTYRSDFLSLGGFHGGDETTGWGGEDLFLYRKYIRSTMRVIRAPDKNIFHLWHPKKCPNSLGPVQRRDCLQSRGRNEASYDQLALLLFSADADGQSHHLSESEI